MKRSVVLACVLALVLAGCTTGPVTAPSAVPAASTLAAASPTLAPTAKPPSVKELTVNLLYQVLPVFTYHKWIEDDLTAAGIKVTPVQTLAGPQIVQNVLSGQAQFGGPLLPAAESAVGAGAEIMVIGLATSGQSFEVVGKPEIKTLKDIEGKRVGVVQVRSTGDAVVKILMGQSGADASKVQWIAGAGGGSALAAAKSGNIDVAVVQPPDNLIIKDELGWHRVADMKSIPQFAYESWITTRAFAKDHPDVVQLFVEALIKALRRQATDKDGWAGLAAQYRQTASRGLLERTFADLQSGNEYKFAIEPLSTESFKDIDWTVDQLLKFEAVTKFVPAQQYVDPSFSMAAAKKLGPMKR